MSLQFKLFFPQGTGQTGVGGSPTVVTTNSITPNIVAGPIRGQGTRYVYRKYFISISQFTINTGAPVISNVILDSIGATSGRIRWDTDSLTDTSITYGTGLVPDINIYDATLRSGHTGVLTSLQENKQYNYILQSTNAAGLSASYDGSFNTLDVTPPVFSNIGVNSITASGARIIWTTNEPSTSQVKYGVSSMTGLTSLDPALVTSHSVTLNTLNSSTSYAFAVISKDASNNSGQSGNFNFITSASTGVPQLVISNVTSGSIGNSGAVITWTTNLPADSTVLYSNLPQALTGGTGILPNVFYNNGLATGHTGTLTSLNPGTRYYYKVKSQDGFGQIVSMPPTGGITGYSFTTIDTLPPFISWSGINVGTGSATISFATNENATGYIKYDTTTNYTNNSIFANYTYPFIKTGSYVSGHSITLNNLSALTSYTYLAVAVDSSSNTGIDIPRSFVTIDTTAPIVTNLTTGMLCTGVSFNWVTNEISSTSGGIWLDAAKTVPYDIHVGQNGSNVTSHVLRFNTVNPSSTYYYSLYSTDPSSNTVTVTGVFTTPACSGTGIDTTPPIITDVQATGAFTYGTVTWNTDEFSSSVVEYTTTTFPGTGATGQSGSNGIANHQVALSPLPESSTIFYKVTSTDAAGNSSTSNTFSFTTSTPGNSNFSEGQTVANLEFEIPAGADTASAYFPIRAVVPIRDEGDLVLNWITENGFIVQREVIKRNGDGTPKLVEVVFPWEAKMTVPAGTKIHISLLATQQTQSYTWNTYALPTLNFRMTMSGPSQVAVAGMNTPDNGIVTQMRGDGTSPYMRTYKIYNRCKIGATSPYHPEIKGAGLHSYVTYYNKDFFPDYYPHIDIRVNNAWVDETSYSTRGAMYYRAMSINYPGVSADGISYKLTADIIENYMTEGFSALVLVKPNSQIPLNPHPDGNVNHWVGDTQAGFNSLYTNDQSDHALLQGTILEWRTALYNPSDSLSKARMQRVAGLEYVAYCTSTPDTDAHGAGARHWSNVAAFGPMNIYCPTVNNNFTWGGFVGREAIDEKHRVTWTTIRNNLINGTYIDDPIAGGGIGLVGNTPTNLLPVQFGPYRPSSPPYDGGAPGGFQIMPFAGFNHSKYSTLWRLYDHKMKLARHYQFMYSSSAAHNDDGEPCTVERWASNTNANPTCNFPGNQPVGTVAIAPLLDRGLEMFYTSFPNSNTYNAPWNIPTVPVTSAHVFANGEGCSYHEDRTVYTPLNGNPDPYSNGRYTLLSLFPTIDHSHQIRYSQNLFVIVELTNDAMVKDDLMMQAAVNMVSFAHKPTSDNYSAGRYNLWEEYYGYNRGGTYVNAGIYPLSNRNKGADFGRSRGWPLYTTVGAYLLGNDAFRAEAQQNMMFYAKYFVDGHNQGLGLLTRSYNSVVLTQHPGLYHNGMRVFLRGDVTSDVEGGGGGWLGYDLVSVYNGTDGAYNTSISSSDGWVTVAQFTTTLDTESPINPWSQSLSKAINGTIQFTPDNWQKAWTVSLSAAVIGGPGVATYKIGIFTKNRQTGEEVDITDPATATCPTTVGSSASTFMQWEVHQINSSGVLDGNEYLPYHGGYDQLVFKIYASTTSVSPMQVITQYGTNYPISVVTTLRGLGTCIYDLSQVFEAHIANLALFSMAANVLKTLDSTNATIILQALKKFYNKFYTVPPISFANENTANSSTWAQLTPTYGAEAWVMAVATNSNYPGTQGPLADLTAGEGKYSILANNHNDSFQYASFSSYIGMRAAIELGDEFTLSPSAIPGTNGFLIDKWCRMSLYHLDPGDHRDYIYANDPLNNSSLVWLSNAAACIGHINYNEDYIFSSPLTTGPTIPGVRVWVSNESTPSRVEIAATPNYRDQIDGPSVVDGDQSNVIFTQDGNPVQTPTFSRARGQSEGVILYNQNGQAGGDVPIDSSSQSSIPFWVRFRMDENTNPSDGYVTFNVAPASSVSLGVISATGDNGATGSTGNTGVIPSNTFIPYNNPSGDKNIHLGALAQGTTSLSQSGNKFIFKYDGDEIIQYEIDFSAGSGNDVGRLRMYERSSNSWPMWEGGMTYKSVSNTTYVPSALAATTSLVFAVIRDNNTVAARYFDNIDGGRNRLYLFQLTGKSMRVTMSSLDKTNNLYTGNYLAASPGVASGIVNPVNVEIMGNGITPIVMFDGPSGNKYYWGSFNDITQSNAQAVTIPEPYTNNTSPVLSNKQYATQYFRNSTGGIAAQVSETWNVGISSKSKDLFGTTTSPVSPYYEDLKNRHHVLLAGTVTGTTPTKWAQGRNSYLEMYKAYTGWGFEKLATYTFYWWTAQPNPNGSPQNYGPNWYPAHQPSQLNQASAFALNNDYLLGFYTIFSVIEPTGEYYVSGYECLNVNGTIKIDTLDTTGYILNHTPGVNIAYQEMKRIKNNYNATYAFYDVDTTQFPSIAWDNLDQRGTPTTNAKTLREGLIQKKLQFDSMRQAVGGPLGGEGSIASYNDGCWLFKGYLDSTERNILTNSGVNIQSMPSGNVRTPTRWWTVVDNEWYVHQPNFVHQGVSFVDRFFSPSDADVHTTPFEYVFPFSTGANDRQRAYSLSHARGGYWGTNGNDDATYNYDTNEQTIMNWYVYNPLQKRMFGSPVQKIEYKTGVNYSGFDSIFKATSTLHSFTGTVVKITLESGFEMYVNHQRYFDFVGIDLNGGADQYIVYGDGFLASDRDGFIAFTAGAQTSIGDTSTNKITYVYDPGVLEFFHGRGTISTYGNIVTTGNNLNQMRIHNIEKNMTIYSVTGVPGFSWPQIIVDNGLT